MVLDKCSVAWTETGGPPYTYTCGGTTTSVLASAPVIGTNLTLSNLALTAGTDNFVRVTLTLPTVAPNTLQGQSSVIQYAFTATQRAASRPVARCLRGSGRRRCAGPGTDVGRCSGESVSVGARRGGRGERPARRCDRARHRRSGVAHGPGAHRVHGAACAPRAPLVVSEKVAVRRPSSGRRHALPPADRRPPARGAPHLRPSPGSERSDLPHEGRREQHARPVDDPGGGERRRGERAYVIPHVGSAIGLLSRGGVRMAVLVFGVLLLLVCGLRALWALRPISWHADDPHGIERRSRKRRATGARSVSSLRAACSSARSATTGFANAKFTNTPSPPAPSFGSGLLPTPTGLGCRWASATTLATSWTAVAAGFATGYDIRRGNTSGGPYSSIGSATPLSTVTFTDSSPGTADAAVLRRRVRQGHLDQLLLEPGREQPVPRQPINLVAGTSLGFSGDNGAATSAQLNTPRGVAVDGSGNVYIADTTNNRIRKVNASTGVITTIAGGGASTGCTFSGAATSGDPVRTAGRGCRRLGQRVHRRHGEQLHPQGHGYHHQPGRGRRREHGVHVQRRGDRGVAVGPRWGRGRQLRQRLHRRHQPQLHSQGRRHHRQPGRGRRCEHGVHVQRRGDRSVPLGARWGRGRQLRQRVHRRHQPQLRPQGRRHHRQPGRRGRGDHHLRDGGGRDPSRCRLPPASRSTRAVAWSSPTAGATASGWCRAPTWSRSPAPRGRPGPPATTAPPSGALTNTPSAIAANASGDLWFADAGTHRVRRVEGPL